MVVVSAARVGGLEPSLALPDVDPLDQPVLDEQLQDAVNRRPAHRRSLGAELVLDLDGAQRARLAVEQVDHALTRTAAVEAGPREDGVDMFGPAHLA
jgi:hypothetical protein